MAHRSDARLLITGGRDYRNQHFAFNFLEGLLTRLDDRTAPFGAWADTARSQAIALVIIQGGATGADALARAWAQLRPGRVTLITEKADWTQHGKAAGPRRNQRMLDIHHPDIVVAFPGGRGTSDMVSRAHKAGVPVIWASEPTKQKLQPRAQPHG